MDTVRKRGEIISIEQRSLVSQRYRRITRAVNSEFGVAPAKLLIVYMWALMVEVLLLIQVTLIYLSNCHETNIINMTH